MRNDQNLNVWKLCWLTLKNLGWKSDWVIAKTVIECLRCNIELILDNPWTWVSRLKRVDDAKDDFSRTICVWNIEKNLEEK